jgi:AraC-like DNA-binding protein
VIAKNMIRENKMAIGDIARHLTYDPSNFTKFFKQYTGQTPKQYREEVLMQKTEMLTI